VLGVSQAELPGLAAAVACVGFALFVNRIATVSPLVVGVLAGMVMANTGLAQGGLKPGLTFSAKRLLRVGVVLLGLRLSLEQVRDLGVVGAITVVGVVLATFFGVQLFARALGLSSGLGLLAATGFSICGTTAVAAMAPVSDADSDETAYAVGLVTLCGTLSIFLLPLVGQLLDLSVQQFGAFAGAGVHDVGQVTATAAAYNDESVAQATLVKLTRVVMLAPMVAAVGLWRRRTVAVIDGASRPPIVPLFVLGFLAMIAIRAIDVVPDGALNAAQFWQQAFLTAGMFGIGAGVELVRLRRLGGRPLILGLGSWAIVAGLALAASFAVA
jgi:uncharacterized integral membrane protein (TIGR00698 family)